MPTGKNRRINGGGGSGGRINGRPNNDAVKKTRMTIQPNVDTFTAFGDDNVDIFRRSIMWFFAGTMNISFAVRRENNR